VKVSRRRLLLYGLLTVAAAARIFLQIAALPPYAGLDEIQHVARLVFVAQEHRNPTTREASIPPYLDASIQQRPDALPSFSQIGERWPEVVRSNVDVVIERRLNAADLRPYAGPNYEAQQPSLYYSLMAPLARLLPQRSAVGELRVWRIASGVLAIGIVLATAIAGEMLFGEIAIAAAALLLMLPTWMTLVLRAGNDALACAFVAIAFAVTAAVPRRINGWILEGLFWAAAFATKLYTWPIGIVAAMLWWSQRADRRRVMTVTGISGMGVVLTVYDLWRRTSNAFGVVAFDRPGGAAYDSGFNLSEIVRVTIASAAWTSGQHWNALKPLAIAVYLGPIFLLLAVAMRRSKPTVSIAAAALIAFASAQAFNVISCVLARRGGNPVPVGGKEGWYWYALAPVLVATMIPPLIARARVVAIVLFAWFCAWDIFITEGALFHDYAGATSPAHPSLLFRWGPLHVPFTANLAGIGVGPLVNSMTVLRLIQIAAIAVLLRSAIRDLRSSHSHSIVDGGFDEMS